MSKISNTFSYNDETRDYIFHCPHCGACIVVEENQVNCEIFRCGKYKISGEQVNPHLSKNECDRLAASGLVWGCCKPFRMYRGHSGKYERVEICDYI